MNNNFYYNRKCKKKIVLLILHFHLKLYYSKLIKFYKYIINKNIIKIYINILNTLKNIIIKLFNLIQ